MRTVIAHHEPLMVVQAASGVGLSGFFAFAAATWYAVGRKVRRAESDDDADAS